MGNVVGEARRIRALRALRILDSAAEPHLEAVCRLAADLFAVPMAAVQLVDENGSGPRPGSGSRPNALSREGAFCDLAIAADDRTPLVIPDLRRDPRSADSPLVAGETGIRFYAGVPLALESGVNLGTFCIMDRMPRAAFPEQALRQLQDLALIVEAHLRLHEARLASEMDANHRSAAESALRASEQRFRVLAETTTDVIIWSDLETTRRYVSPAVRAVLGYEPEALIGTKPWPSCIPTTPPRSAACSKI